MKAADLRASLFLILAIVVPYHRLTTMRSIIVTDDRIVSDVFHGELPARVELARLLHAGELPVWTQRLCTGHPLIAGMFPDPLTLLTFGLLPTVAALNVFLLLTLIIASLSAYALARRFGASALGGTLAGLSFGWSGYMVCQLKHLGIVATVCWLPLGWLLLDRALALDETLDGASDETTLLERLRRLVPFALIVALQWVSNFPQSAYICSVTYAAIAFGWGVVHARKSWRVGSALVIASGVAVALGIVCAAAALLPLRELAGVSDRQGGVSWEFASMLPYSPRDAITFFIPHANGDVSNDTYRSSGLFWENYGYVGLLTTLLALFAITRIRRDVRVLFLTLALIGAYLIVLGPATPVFKVLFHALPGMSNFRFPTRWLVVVDLSLAVLGGLGLTLAEQRLRNRGAAVAIVALTTIDLVFHQLRQNAFADSKQWMEPPATAAFVRSERIYTPLHNLSHSTAFSAAHGWSDLAPYYAHRALLQPNTNILWGLDTCDCYAGLMPSTSSIVWGPHGLVNQTTARRGAMLSLSPRLLTLLSLNSVGFVLSTWTVQAEGVREVFRSGDVGVYAVPHLPRAFVVGRAVSVANLQQAIQRTGELDPATSVVLEGALDVGTDVTTTVSGLTPAASPPGHAHMIAERSTELAISTDSSGPAWLVVTDQWYPGWRATVDGVEVPIVRANARHRAVRIPGGSHRVLFTYRSESLARGAKVSALGLLTLLALYLGLTRWARRSSPRRAAARSAEDPSHTPA